MAGKPASTKVVDVDLVIFDCDGVLVESEGISSQVLSEHLRKTGLKISTEEVNARFMGPRLKDIVVEVGAAVGRELGDAWITEFEERRAKIFETQLRSISGARDAVSLLAGLGVGLCVATQGRLETTHRKLALVGLSEFFPPGTVFSADEVPHGKPDPGVFLHAAESMGVEPERCVVIEDSAEGVKAALRAGMQVFHYRGDSRTVSEAGARPLSSLAGIRQLLATI